MSVVKKNKWKSAWVDVLALNSFSYIVSAPIELLVAGMSFEEHLKVRFFAFLLNTLVARPFGMWREFVVAKTQLQASDGFFKTYWVDTLIFFSFQLPLYIGNLLLGGADFQEIWKASVTVAAIAGTLGRPYGVFLDWLRVLHGLPHSLKSQPCAE